MDGDIFCWQAKVLADFGQSWFSVATPTLKSSHIPSVSSWQSALRKKYPVSPYVPSGGPAKRSLALSGLTVRSTRWQELTALPHQILLQRKGIAYSNFVLSLQRFPNFLNAGMHRVWPSDFDIRERVIALWVLVHFAIKVCQRRKSRDDSFETAGVRHLRSKALTKANPTTRLIPFINPKLKISPPDF